MTKQPTHVSVSEPERWADGDSQHPLGGLLRSAREDLPDAVSLAAVAADLGQSLGPAGPGAATPSFGVVKPALGLLATLVVVGSGTLWWVGRPPDPPQDNRARVEQALQRVAEPDTLDRDNAPSIPPRRPTTLEPRPTRVASPAPRPGRVEPAPAQRESREHLLPVSEADLIGRARRLLGSEPARSLAVLEEHRRQFGRGALVEEREVLMIDACVNLGRGDEARQRAAAFGVRFPTSVHLGHVRAALDRLSSNAEPPAGTARGQ